MNPKPPILRQQAEIDVDQAVDHYLSVAPGSVASAFIGALEDAYDHIGRLPASGSARYAVQQGLRDFRSWPVAGFPYIVFYIERDDHVEVQRVLHTSRDIAESLSEGLGE